MYALYECSLLILFGIIYIGLFSRTGDFLDKGDKLSPFIQHGFLRSEEKENCWDNIFFRPEEAMLDNW